MDFNEVEVEDKYLEGVAKALRASDDLLEDLKTELNMIFVCLEGDKAHNS